MIVFQLVKRILVSGPLLCASYFLFWLSPQMKREVAIVYYTITFSMFYIAFTVTDKNLVARSFITTLFNFLLVERLQSYHIEPQLDT